MSLDNTQLVGALTLFDRLLFDSRFQSSFQSPINKELLSHKLAEEKSKLENDDESRGEAGTQGSFQNYHDFLLPLPESLIPTETGIIHPDVVNASQSARGMGTKMDSNHRKSLEKKLAQEFKQKLKNTAKAKPKLGLMPTPFGTQKREED